MHLLRAAHLKAWVHVANKNTRMKLVMEGHGPMEPARAGPGRRIQLPGLCTLCPLEVSVWQPSRLCPLVTRTPSAGLLSLWPTLLAACRNLNHIQVLCVFFLSFVSFLKSHQFIHGGLKIGKMGFHLVGWKAKGHLASFF